MSLKFWLPLEGATNSLDNKGSTPYMRRTLNDLTVATNGKIGQCYSGQAIYHLDQEILGNKWSVCAWIKADAWYASNNIILCKNINDGTTHQIYFSIIGGTSLVAQANSVSTSVAYTFSTGTWYHVAATYDGSTVSLYVNGVLLKTTAVTAAFVSGMNNIGLNCRSNNAAGTAKWLGDTSVHYLNDVKLYDECLSPFQIYELSRGLVAHYKFDSFANGWGNPNLLNNSRTLGTGFGGSGTKLTSWNGFTVIQKDNTSGTSITDTCVYNNVVTVNPNEIYTASFWARADTAHDIICYFYNNTSGVVQSAHRTCSNGLDGTGSSDGSTTITLSTQWTYYWITWTFGSSGTAANKTLILGRQSAGQGTIYIAAPKIERGAYATPWAPSVADGYYRRIYDESGHGHHLEVIGEITLANTSMRNTSCVNFTANTQYARALGDQGFVTGGFSSTYSFCWWGKNNTWSGVMQWGWANGTRLNGIYNGVLWNTGDGGNNPLYQPGTTTQVSAPDANWHHWAMVADGSTCKVYQDGTLWAQAKTFKTIASCTGLYFNGWDTSTSYKCTQLYLSDFRFYATALSADYIKHLAAVDVTMDNSANVIPYTVNEQGTTPQVTQVGESKTGAIIEPFITLPDNSYWQLVLYHQVDNGTRLFTSSNATYCNDYGLYSRLRDINNYTYNGSYEFYVIQDGHTYRWTQTSQPTASSITGLTTVSGYGDPVHGLAKASQSNTYLGYGSWWGACGCWTSYTQYGVTGIPGFGSTSSAIGICTKYLALYARVSKPRAFAEPNAMQANEFIER